MNEAVISVGSNIEPHLNTKLARQYVAEISNLVKVSDFYVTKAMESAKQGDFLNGGFLVRTDFSYIDFKQELKKIEIKQGRVKTSEKTDSHCIDLDIIVWNNQIKDDTFYKWDFIKKIVLELKPDLSY